MDDQISNHRRIASLIESWIHLLSDFEITNPEAIAHVNEKEVHEAQQQTTADLAAATPGADPHITMPWTDDMAMAAFT